MFGTGKLAMEQRMERTGFVTQSFTLLYRRLAVGYA